LTTTVSHSMTPKTFAKPFLWVDQLSFKEGIRLLWIN
jgi:hypothetical protein